MYKSINNCNNIYDHIMSDVWNGGLPSVNPLYEYNVSRISAIPVKHLYDTEYMIYIEFQFMVCGACVNYRNYDAVNTIETNTNIVLVSTKLLENVMVNTYVSFSAMAKWLKLYNVVINNNGVTAMFMLSSGFEEMLYLDLGNSSDHTLEINIYDFEFDTKLKLFTAYLDTNRPIISADFDRNTSARSRLERDVLLIVDKECDMPYGDYTVDDIQVSSDNVVYIAIKPHNDLLSKIIKFYQASSQTFEENTLKISFPKIKCNDDIDKLALEEAINIIIKQRVIDIYGKFDNDVYAKITRVEKGKGSRKRFEFIFGE